MGPRRSKEIAVSERAHHRRQTSSNTLIGLLIARAQGPKFDLGRSVLPLQMNSGPRLAIARTSTPWACF
eukprot:3315939-Pyramimonas_sp.AAC.1